MYQKKLPITFEKQTVFIPYVEIEGKEEGRHIFISGGMHGNEVNGIMAVQEFLKWAKEKNLNEKIKGKITVLPLLNPTAFSHAQRDVYEDGRDLNRSFGVDKPTTLSEKIAQDLTERIFKHCEMGIDCHDSGKGLALVPHTRIHVNEDIGCVNCTREMGQLIGTDVVVERKGEVGMLAVEMDRKYFVPIVTIELGGSQKIENRFLKRALRGIKNVLVANEMIQGEIMVPDKQFILMDRYGVQVKKASIIEFDVMLGDEVHVDQKIGILFDPFTNTRQDIISPMCGIIFSLWTKNQVKSGQTIYSILENKKCHVDRTTLDKFEEMDKFDVRKIDL